MIKGDHAKVEGFKGINRIDRSAAPGILNNCTASEIPTFDAYSNIVTSPSGMTFSQISCSEDVVIMGSPFLKNAAIKTSAEECRFYVDGNVWIDGDAVSYIDDVDGKPHLQITSTGSISFGLYNDPSGNSDQPESGHGGSLLRSMLRHGKYLAWANMIRRATRSTSREENYTSLKTFINSLLCDGTYAPNNFFTTIQRNAGIKNLKKVIFKCSFN